MKYLNYTLSNKQMCEVSAGFLFLSLKFFFQEEVHLLFIFLNYQYSNNLCGLKKNKKIITIYPSQKIVITNQSCVKSYPIPFVILVHPVEKSQLPSSQSH